jgi:hypothetical protein
MPRSFTFNPPRWSGEPVLIATLWTLHKDGRRALCTLWNHPAGAELRVDIDGRAPTTRAGRDFELLLNLSDELNAELVVRGGWSQPSMTDPGRNRKIDSPT